MLAHGRRIKKMCRREKVHFQYFDKRRKKEMKKKPNNGMFIDVVDLKEDEDVGKKDGFKLI